MTYISFLYIIYKKVGLLDYKIFKVSLARCQKVAFLIKSFYCWNKKRKLKLYINCEKKSECENSI